MGPDRTWRATHCVPELRCINDIVNIIAKVINGIKKNVIKFYTNYFQVTGEAKVIASKFLNVNVLTGLPS